MDWFLIIVVAAVILLTIALSLYLIVIYQHPEDDNQAWFPKLVVLLGLCVSIWTVLLFPLDVANEQSCTLDIPLTDCEFTFPMRTMWEALYIANMLLVFVFIPFTLFFYESDSEWPPARRWISALLWTLGVMAIVSALIGIPYAFAGYAKFDVKGAVSGMLPVSYLSQPDGINGCVAPYATKQSGNALTVNTTPPLPITGSLCNTATSLGSEVWKVRVSLITYAMSVIATLGWLLFLLFGAIGLVSLPLDWIRAFVARPRSTITRSQYMDRARDLARRARDIRDMAEGLKRQERESGRSRKWRQNAAALQLQLEILEEDEAQLERVFPQGEDPSYSWTLTVITFWLKLVGGLVALALSVAWVLQIILYILVDPPVTPLLNSLFISAGDVFPLFGTALFALFVFYLQAAVMKGNFRFGLNFVLFRVHPMRVGNTIMSSFLFNVALVLLASTAAIQFASSAFALYAQDTAILDIYGNTLRSLEGIRFIYTENIYIYAFLGVIFLTTVILLVRGPDAWKRRKPLDAYR